MKRYNVTTRQTNLLEKWYDNAKVISSHLNINQIVSRDKVVYIYETLLSFFGTSYFEIIPGIDKPIEKITWIYSLLSNENSLGCIDALFEISELIQYSSTLDETIQKELLDLKHSPQNLRTFFFELFVFKRLDENRIQNKKKYFVGAQEIEGTCTIAEKLYLFECRKIFLPKIQELDILRRLLMDFDKYGKTLTKGMGMICSITFNWPITGKHRSNFESRIREFFKALNQLTYAHIDYNVSDEYGTFRAIDYDEATLIEIKGSKKYDILHYVIPPKVPVPGQANFYQGKVLANFFTLQSKIHKKFEEALKEKKRQHKNSPFKEKIIFIDSESLPEFQMGLFINEMMFERGKIAAICKKIHENNIVCMIRRRYLSDGYEILVDTFGNEQNKNVVKVLNQIFGKQRHAYNL